MQVFLDTTIGVGDHKQCNVQPKQSVKERFDYQLLDKLHVLLRWQGEEKIGAGRPPAPGLGSVRLLRPI